MKKLITLLSLIIILQSLTFAQYPIPILAGQKMPTDFINAKGETVFSLPAEEQLITKEEFDGTTYNTGNVQMLNVFSEEVAVVKRGDNSYYLLDKEGEMIKDFGTFYGKIGAFSKGYCVARIASKDYLNPEYVFLDKEGKAAFASKKFSFARTFSDGLAVVKTKSSEWIYIDKLGNPLINISDISSAKIFNVGNFSNGMAKIRTANSTFFINEKGKVMFDLNEVLAGRKVKKVNDFQNGYLDLKVNDERNKSRYILFLNKKGKEICRLSHTKTYYVFPDKIVSKKSSEPIGILQESNKFFFFFSDDRREEISNDSREIWKLLGYAEQAKCFIKEEAKDFMSYWTKELKNSPIKDKIKNSKGIIGQYEDLVFLLYSGQGDCELINKSGKSIYRTPVGKRTFYNINKALNYKDEVKRFHLLRSKTIPQELSQLKNLEYLNIEENIALEIPIGISELKSLRYLTLNGLYKIKELPRELSNLEQLEYLEISDLENFEGIEYIVENLPALKKVYVINYSFSKEFKEKMKRKNPKLKFDGFTYKTILKD